MRVYIAGRISGNPYGYRAEFDAAEERLRAMGHSPVNPAKNPPQSSWRGYMVESISQLVQCEAIYMLPKWWKSRGARIERFIAWALGMPAIYL